MKYIELKFRFICLFHCQSIASLMRILKKSTNFVVYIKYFSYLCHWIVLGLFLTYRIIKKRIALTCVRKRRNFSEDARRQAVLTP